METRPRSTSPGQKTTGTPGRHGDGGDGKQDELGVRCSPGRAPAQDIDGVETHAATAASRVPVSAVEHSPALSFGVQPGVTFEPQPFVARGGQLRVWEGLGAHRKQRTRDDENDAGDRPAAHRFAEPHGSEADREDQAQFVDRRDTRYRPELKGSEVGEP